MSTPELCESNTSLHHAQSMDANQWTGIKSGRQRASSVWSANSTALRVSIAKALNQKNNLNATSRRPTTTTLLSLNPPGLRNGKVTSSYLIQWCRKRAGQERAIKGCQMGWIGCPAFQVAQKAIVEKCLFQILITNTKRKQVLTTYIQRRKKCAMIVQESSGHQNWFVSLIC